MPGRDRKLFLAAMRRFLVVTAMGHLVWEMLQMPVGTQYSIQNEFNGF